MQPDIKSILTFFKKEFPIKIDYYVESSAEEMKHNFLYSCPAFQKANRSGVPMYIHHKPMEHTCQVCPFYSDCSIGTACFVPIHVDNNLLGTICIQPESPDQAPWIQQNYHHIEDLIRPLITVIAFQQETIKLKEENGLLKQEIKNLLRMSNEPWMILNLDGIVTEASQYLCTLVDIKRSHLIGESVTKLIPLEKWHSIKAIPESGLRCLLLKRVLQCSSDRCWWDNNGYRSSHQFLPSGIIFGRRDRGSKNQLPYA
jgi:transcriptional regulator with GAF, ATPase, and Fis domain